MKTLARLVTSTIIGLAMAMLAIPSLPALADTPGTATTQTATRYDACTPINKVGAANAQITLTIPAVAGQYIYVAGIDLTAAQNATATVATLSQFTSTNLGGWIYQFSLAATANAQVSEHFYFTTPLKAPIAGTAVTIVSPAAATNTAFNINACYYTSNL